MALKLTFLSSSSTETSQFILPSAQEIIEINRKIKEYDAAMEDFSKRLERTCNAKKAYAFNCWTNKKLIQSCVTKALQQKLNSDGVEACHTYIKHIKGAYTLVFQYRKKSG